MSVPLDISQNRRKSIARLTSPPIESPSRSPRAGSKTGSFSNTHFLRRFEEGSQLSQDLDVIQSDDEPLEEPDPKLIEQIAKHLPENSAPLLTEGGDITRDIYKYGDRPTPRRAHSFDSSTSRRSSFASLLNVPGGFRREYVIRTKKVPTFWTRNFVEFLSVYGHFAGEVLEDDEDIACHFELRKTDEEAALLAKRPTGTASETKAYFLLLKAFVGTGVLFLPRAFYNGGLLFSVGTLVFFGVLSYWCYLILVYTKVATNVAGFSDIGRKLYGPWFQQVILLSIVLSQVGFVAAYIVFTGENLAAFVRNVSGHAYPLTWFIGLQVVLFIPLAWIRDITKLSLLALFANVFILIGLVTIVWFVLQDLVAHGVGPNVEYVFNKSGFSLFIGVAIFAFEGIGLIIPIQESMVRPENFPKVLFQVVLTILIIFIGVGALGYLTYGDSIDTVILLNLPQLSPLIVVIQLLYAFAILLSTPIQIFPAIRLIEQKLFKRTGKHSPSIKWLKNLERALFVIVTATIASYGGSNLDAFVSFVGTFACIPLVYMYPPILHIKSCCDYSRDTDGSIIRKKKAMAALNYAILVVGLLALIYNVYIMF